MPTAPEATEVSVAPTPESPDARRAELRRIVGLAFRQKAKEAHTDGMTPRDKAAIDLGKSIFTDPNPRRDFDAEPEDARLKPLLMLSSFDFSSSDGGDGVIKDGAGKEIAWNAGKMRIAGILGRPKIDDSSGEVDPDKVVVAFKYVGGDKNDSFVMEVDNDTKGLALTMSNDELFATLAATQDAFAGLIPEDTVKDVASAGRQEMQRERGLPITEPAGLPSAYQIATFKTEIGIPDAPSPEVLEAGTPLEQASALIEFEIDKLERGLEEYPENSPERKKAQAKLFVLRLADVAKGESGVLVKAYALNVLHQSGEADFTGPIDALKREVDIEQSNFDYAILTELRKLGVKENDVADLRQMLKDGNIVGLIEDKRFQKVGELTKKLFGENLSRDDMKQLIQTSRLSPEYKKMLDDAIEGGASGESLLALLFLLIGAPIFAGGAVAFEAPEVMKMFSGGR